MCGHSRSQGRPLLLLRPVKTTLESKMRAATSGALKLPAEDPDSYESWTKEALYGAMQWIWRDGRRVTTMGHFARWDLCHHHVHEEGVNCLTKESGQK